MFTYVEFFRLIFSFQFITELKMNFLFCLRNKKNDCVYLQGESLKKM